MNMRSLRIGLVSLTLSLGLIVLSATINAAAAIALLEDTASTYQERDLTQQLRGVDETEKIPHVPRMGFPNDNGWPAPFSLSEAGILVAAAPSGEACEGEWDMTTSHKTLVCIDGFWHNIDFEHWVCDKPNKVVEHRHQSRTQDACEAR